MADALILNNLRTGYQILSRNVTRTLYLHSDAAEHLTRQIAHVLQFLTEVDQV
jgi:hypothetical protein